MKYFSALSHLWANNKPSQPQLLPSKKTFLRAENSNKRFFLLDFKSYASGWRWNSSVEKLFRPQMTCERRAGGIFFVSQGSRGVFKADEVCCQWGKAKCWGDGIDLRDEKLSWKGCRGFFSSLSVRMKEKKSFAKRDVKSHKSVPLWVSAYRKAWRHFVRSFGCIFHDAKRNCNSTLMNAIRVTWN